VIPRDNIREANFKDASLLPFLIRESFRDVAKRFGLTQGNCPKHPSNCISDWVEKDLARGVSFDIIEYNLMVTGCVGFEKVNSDLCYLERLGVLPEYRRKGFGKALVNHVIAQADLFGAKHLGIGVITDDTELTRWYKRIGFIEGETKEFLHLQFRVTFMKYDL
jgi:GNAT superfamily N-acetyltransferase